jgi:hypothetical protein
LHASRYPNKSKQKCWEVCDLVTSFLLCKHC